MDPLVNIPYLSPQQSYSYAYNNPANFRDNNGMFGCSERNPCRESQSWPPRDPPMPHTQKLCDDQWEKRKCDIPECHKLATEGPTKGKNIFQLDIDQCFAAWVLWHEKCIATASGPG